MVELFVQANNEMLYAVEKNGMCLSLEWSWHRIENVFIS